jgi:[ribosomal protein S5]-alanine N-acetyltransferase
MKRVRLHTDRLIIRDLPPRFCRQATSFHRDNLHFHQQWEPARPDEYYTAAAQRRILLGERRAENMLHLWMLEAAAGVQVRPPVIVGSITLSSIVRGGFQSCFLGYKLDSRFARRGYMHEALCAVIDHAFTGMKLHRLEANVMPENDRSLKLLAGIGFREEGRSTRYLKIRGQWRDHLHMVMLEEEWKGCG